MSRFLSFVIVGVLGPLLMFVEGCKRKSSEPTTAAAPSSASQPAPTTPAAPAAPPAATSPISRATASIAPKSGSTMRGSATFLASGTQVTLDVRIEGAPPGQRAIHLHEKGDCSAADATSAGDHWNPQQSAHGKWGTPPHHLGDVGNMQVGADGRGSFTLTTDRWTIGTGAPNDILRKSLVIHGGTDDFRSQPAGNAGNRIGCGVIEPGRST